MTTVEIIKSRIITNHPRGWLVINLNELIVFGYHDLEEQSTCITHGLVYESRIRYGRLHHPAALIRVTPILTTTWLWKPNQSNYHVVLQRAGNVQTVQERTSHSRMTLKTMDLDRIKLKLVEGCRITVIWYTKKRIPCKVLINGLNISLLSCFTHVIYNSFFRELLCYPSGKLKKCPGGMINWEQLVSKN